MSAEAPPIIHGGHDHWVTVKPIYLDECGQLKYVPITEYCDNSLCIHAPNIIAAAIDAAINGRILDQIPAEEQDEIFWRAIVAFDQNKERGTDIMRDLSSVALELIIDRFKYNRSVIYDTIAQCFPNKNHKLLSTKVILIGKKIWELVANKDIKFIKHLDSKLKYINKNFIHPLFLDV